MSANDFPEMALNTLMLEDTDVAAVVGTRIYPIFPPQNQAGPFIVYSLISQLPDRHLMSASTLQHVRIQIDCYAKTDDDVMSSYGVVKTLANKVRLALDGFRGQVTLADGDTVHIDSLSLSDGSDLSKGPNGGGDTPLLYLSSDYLVGSQLSFTLRAIPTDYAHLWYTADYTTMYKDSFELPAQQLVDRKGSNNLSVRTSITFPTNTPIPIVHSTSAPDGVSMYYPSDTQSSAESAIVDTATAIDINGAGAISFGGWFKNELYQTGTTKRRPVAMQGGDWDTMETVGNAPDANSIGVYVEVDATTPKTPVEKYGVYAYFDGAGMVELKSNAVTHNEWVHVWIQLTGTRIEIWIDGVLDSSVNPSGATALNISTDNTFTYFQSKGVNPSSWAGGTPANLYMYSRALTSSEIEYFMSGASNIDTTTKLLRNDTGARVNPATCNLLDPQTYYYPNYKTASPNVWDGDTGDAAPSGQQRLSIRRHLTTPIFRGGAKVEVQFRINIAPSSENSFLLGFGLYHFGLESDTAHIGLGSASRTYAVDVFRQWMRIAGVTSGSDLGPIGTGGVFTLRLNPTDPDDVTYEILANNSLIHSGSILSSDWDAEGILYFACGKNVKSSPYTKGFSILSNETDAAYPLGTGYKFLGSA